MLDTPGVPTSFPVLGRWLGSGFCSLCWWLVGWLGFVSNLRQFFYSRGITCAATFQVGTFLGVDYELICSSPSYRLFYYRTNTDGGLGEALRQSKAAPFNWRHCERQGGCIYYPGFGRKFSC